MGNQSISTELNNVYFPHLENEAEFVGGNCKPPPAINFVRIPKAGTSTLLNIMYRYMEARRLDPVLLFTELIYPGSRLADSSFMIPKNASPAYGNYSFFGDHMVFNSTEAHRLLRPGFINLANIRHPLSQLEAIFNEWRAYKRLNISSESPVLSYLEGLVKGLYTNRSDMAFHVQNMGHLLGLPYQQAAKKSALGTFLRDIDKQFPAIIVREYYDESLVLMRRRLCWETKDIIYRKLRTRDPTKTRINIPWYLERVHRAHSPAEYAIYDFFINRLFRHIEREPYFWQELKRFKDILARMSDFCGKFEETIRQNRTKIYEIAENPDHLYIDGSPFGKPFNVSGMDCMTMSLHTMAQRWHLAAKKYPSVCQDYRHKVSLDACSARHPQHGIPLKMFLDWRSYLTG